MAQHILVVDDEAPIRHLLSRYFKRHGYKVSTAATATETWRVLKESKLDLILLDIVLPDGNGLEMIESLKAEYPHLPIIMITGMGFVEECLQEAHKKGADGYFSKGLPLNQLLVDVVQTLKFKKAEKR